MNLVKNKLFLTVLLVMLIPELTCVARLKIKTVDARDTPISQVEGILKLFLSDGRANWANDLLSANQWCVYFRFLYDHVLSRSRFSFDARLDQVKVFMTAHENQVHSDFLSFGVSLLNLTQSVSTNSLIYEPTFQKFVYPFIQNEEEQNKISLLDNLIAMLEPKFKMNEFALSEEFERSEEGPCLDMLEMIHFIFLMGYSNVGLKYSRDKDLPYGERTGNTARMVSHLVSTLFSNSKSQDSFIQGIEYFTLVLKAAFDMQENEFYLNLNLFAGDTDEEKQKNRAIMLSNLLVYYAKMQENFNMIANKLGNPHLEQFFVKGGVMLCTYGIKQYVIGDIAVAVSDDETVQQVANYMITEAAHGTVGKAIDYINIPKLVATKEQQLSKASEVNILQNLIVAVSGETLCSIYIQIDVEFLKVIQSAQTVLAVNFRRRMLI